MTHETAELDKEQGFWKGDSQLKARVLAAIDLAYTEGRVSFDRPYVEVWEEDGDFLHLARIQASPIVWGALSEIGTNLDEKSPYNDWLAFASRALGIPTSLLRDLDELSACDLELFVQKISKLEPGEIKST